MPDSIVLFVFEGERTEGQIFGYLAKKLLANRENSVRCVYGANIYQLHKELAADEDLDLFILLKESVVNRKNLEGIRRDQVAEVHMFFDYDGHADQAPDEKINNMLELFDNETDHGRLYISYPMIESIRHMPDNDSFAELTSEIDIGRRYKNKVHEECSMCYSDMKKLDKEAWLHLIFQHCCKANHLLTGDFVFPATLIEQKALFCHQKTKHIDPHREVAVICALPLYFIENHIHIKHEVMNEQYLRQNRAITRN